MNSQQPTSTGVDGQPSEIAHPDASLAQDLRHVGCGLLMGAADIVPGVSGGTVALILNVYERLINAITKANKTFVTLLLKREFRAAAEHIDFRFIAALGTGIGVGILSLAKLMHFLLEVHKERTHAVFCGLILASTLLVARRVVKWKPMTVVAFVFGVAFAATLAGLSGLQSPPAGRWYIFVCGMIGICAMILPGISGSFILVFLGTYERIIALLRSIVHLEFTMDGLLTVITFCFGCLTGLLVFSRVLKWQLARHHDFTMALLAGFMLGSLRLLWPLAWPIPQNRESVLLLTLFVLATAVVLLADLWARVRKMNIRSGSEAVG